MIAGLFSELLIQSRLYFSLIPSLACLAGAGFTAITQIKSFNIRFARIMGVLITLVFLLTAYEITRDILRKDSTKVVLGIETTGNYLGNNLGWSYPAMEAINGLPEGAKVLMLWEPRAYYCLPKCIPDEVIDRWSHELSLRHDAKTIINYWKSIGVSHILFYKLGAEFIKDEDHRTTSARYTHKDWPSWIGSKIYLVNRLILDQIINCIHLSLNPII